MNEGAVMTNLLGAGRDIRDRLRSVHFGALLLWILVAIVPVVAEGRVSLRALTLFLLYALAAVGLNFVMGLGNMASVGHGAFMATGAVVAAMARVDLGWNFVASLVLAVAGTAALALLVGSAAVRLRAVHLALSSWLGAWFVALVLASFPAISGGAEGVAVPEASIGEGFGFTWRLTSAVHYEVALVALTIALVLFRCLKVSSIGLMLATMRQNPRQASVIGTLRDDIRLKVFVFGASLAGVAGALVVQSSGIFDHRSFGILLSVSMFLAVLVGGLGHTFGPLLGAAVVALLPIGGQPLTPFFSTNNRIGELVAGVVLLLVVGLRARMRLRTPLVGHREDGALPAAQNEPLEPPEPPVLSVEDVAKSFGGVKALQGVTLSVRGGRVHGVMGPNGSGKSTLLGIVSGHLFPDEGKVILDGRDVTRAPGRERLRLGIARTTQSTELFPELTCLDHLSAAGLAARRYGGFVRAMCRTPLARKEEGAARSQARAFIEDLRLNAHANTVAARVPAGDRRILMMGMAAAGRRVVVLDEPSSGLSAEEVVRATEIISDLKRRGAAVVVVEHNMRLLRGVADEITVLDGGRLIAHGPPSQVYEDPAVRAAYLGSTKGDVE